ncbi:HD domain-containing protein [Litorivita sp. NS0012-18]|uniref:HD domain-containing protein n=1 Tax=Litorivita sp. NS0012-18 TaxID=3127655 RepID=UPI00333F5008
MAARLDAQMAFLNEVDKLKSVMRATTLCDGTRRENSGEHSWHIALYAMTLAEHAGPDVDIARVIKMLLLHDIVEIDSGDNPIYGTVNQAQVEAEEEAAALRIFGLLPSEQAREFIGLWREFEAAKSADAIFAKSLDRFQPPNQNLASGGGSWAEYNVQFDTIESRVGSKVARGAPRLWAYIAPKIQAWFAQNR